MDIGDDDSNKSIFDDLLSEQEQPKSAPSFFFDAPRSKPENPADECIICEVTEEDRILSCGKEVVGISCTEDLLVLTCCDEKEGLVVQAYSLKEDSIRENSQRNCALRIPLPSSTGILGVRNTWSKACAPKLRLVTFAEKETSACQSTSSSSSSSSSQIILPPHLFSLLFGWETKVRILPVLLCSLPGGDAYFQAVDLTNTGSTHSWQQVCALSTPVVDIFCMKLKRNLSENEAISVELHQGLGMTSKSASHSSLDTALVVGRSGRCCVLTAVPAIASNKADYRLMTVTFELPNAVRCACMLDGRLCVSTGQSVVRHTLMLHSEKQDGEQKKFKVQVQTEMLRSGCAISSLWLSGNYNTDSFHFIILILLTLSLPKSQLCDS
jgi:hypothetical protein